MASLPEKAGVPAVSPHPPTYSKTAGHRARQKGSSQFKLFAYLVVLVGLLGATRRRLTLSLPSSPSWSSSDLGGGLRGSQWDSLPKDYVICSPQQRNYLLTKRSERRGAIYTGHDDQGQDGYVACLAVSNGAITSVGSEAKVLQEACGLSAPVQPHPRRKGLPHSLKAHRLHRTRPLEPRSPSPPESCDVRRLKRGQTLFPGFQDAHGHVLDYGWSRTVVDLVGSTSKEEVVKRIEDFVRASPELLGYALTAEGHDDGTVRWIEGLGWDQTKWPEPVFPTATDLSRSFLLRRFAISLRRIDVHALWLSEVAMEIVQDKADGFPRTPTDDGKVEGGLILRDAVGKPTGVLVDNAMNFAYQVIPKWTFDQRQKYLDAAAQGLLQAGITAVGDAATDLDAVEFYKTLDLRGQLPFRIYSFLACPPGEPRCIRRTPMVLPTQKSRFTLRAVKLFADGALGSWGSAMWEDYTDKPGDRGLLLMREEEVEPLIRYIMDQGWQVGTHAIGDRANTLVLDAYEAIRKKAKLDGRPRVEHAQILRLQDAERFGRLGVIASMQPTHCTSDMGYVDSRIGAERARGAYAWKTLLRHNATLALGSDFPVELPDPLHGIYSSITRLDPQGNSPGGRGGWHPRERLGRREALRGFTLDTSYAQFEEDQAGSIRVKKRADFTLLDRDVLDEESVSPLSLRNAQVDATIIGGDVAYDRLAVGSASEALAQSDLGRDVARELAREMAEEIVALVQQIWYGHSPLLLSALTCVLLLGLGIFRRKEANKDAYSDLSALALNGGQGSAEWMNMGYWKETTDFSTAARQLAELLHTSAGVTKGSRILDVGCGAGDSVLLLRQKFTPSSLDAVTFLERDAARTAQRLHSLYGGTKEGTIDHTAGQVRVWCGDAIEWLIETSATTEDASEEEPKYDFILALDCAFHFASRSDFFQLAYRRLAPGGTLALFDLLSAWPAEPGRIGSKERKWRYEPSETLAAPSRRPSAVARLRHAVTCKLTGVSPSTLWSAEEYATRLMQSGFGASSISIRDVSGDVFPGFARFLRSVGKEDGKAQREGLGRVMLFALRSFGGVVERWAEGGDAGLTRCAIVVARKASQDAEPEK